MTKVYHRTFFLAGPAGRLESLLWTSQKPSPAMAAVVCHPHPLFGGTMHNKVVFQAAKTLHRLGLPVLRFNFRGAGLSEGEHDKGKGERDDVRAALDFLAQEFPGLPILLGGFSFGAWVGLRVGCEDARVAEVAGLGLPVNSSRLDYLRECRKPKLIIQGTLDQFGSRDKVEELYAELPEPKRVVFVEEADHFFAGKLNEADAALRAWMRERHPEL
jgi:alpha/beta superfamily hydrolase